MMIPYLNLTVLISYISIAYYFFSNSGKSLCFSISIFASEQFKGLTNLTRSLKSFLCRPATLHFSDAKTECVLNAECNNAASPIIKGPSSFSTSLGLFCTVNPLYI